MILDAFELIEELGEGFPHHIDKDVQASSVGHTEDGSSGLVIRGTFKDLVQDRKCRLAPFKRKPFRAQKLGMEEVLKELGLCQLAERLDTLIGGECQTQT